MWGPPFNDLDRSSGLQQGVKDNSLSRLAPYIIIKWQVLDANPSHCKIACLQLKLEEPWLLPQGLGPSGHLSSSCIPSWASNQRWQLPCFGLRHGPLPTPPSTATRLPQKPWVCNQHCPYVNLVATVFLVIILALSHQSSIELIQL